MRAILVRGTGELAELYMGEAPPPALKPGEIRIKVQASGVNRADILQRRGLYPPPAGASEILGLEVAGEVSELGPDAKAYRVGDRVMALLPGGGYAEEVCVDETLAMPLPAAMPWAEGAAIPEAFITAHHNLFTLGGAALGCSALIHAGASGVGTAGIQLLNGLASTIFVTVGSSAKAAACEALGAVPILYKHEPFAQVIKARLAKGVNVILDPIGGSYFSANLDCLAVSGRLVLIGLMGGRNAQADLAIFMAKRIRLIGSTLRNLPLSEKVSAVAALHAFAAKRLANGELKAVVDQAYPAADAAKAHSRMEENANIGKLVLTW